MAEHILNASVEIPLPREKVFDFFSDAGNLERITPPYLKFRILTPQPINLKKGALIDYQLTLRGIPVKWRTEISEWNPPFEFVDTQLRGPYKQWIHRHTFTELDSNRTLIEDEVRYRLPFEPLGDIFNFLISRDLKNVFDYREKTVADLIR